MSADVINERRFAFALRELTSAAWERFERLATTFLSGDFDDIRVTASPSGDRGRDAQLFRCSDPSVLLQYSVTTDWRSKINETVNRLRDEFPNANMLVYVTNQSIGSDADDLVKTLRTKKHIHLDVRDGSWFLARCNKDRHRELAAEQLAKEVVDPLLQANGLIERRATPLTILEARAALVHLELQLANAEKGQGLTKTAFEALVRSALRGTDAENPMNRKSIRESVYKVLPSHDSSRIDPHVDRALKKLTTRIEGKRLVQWNKKTDVFWLYFEEKERLDTHLLQAEDDENNLREQLKEIISDHASTCKIDKPIQQRELDDLLARARRILDAFLLGRGEAFVSATKTGRYDDLGFISLRDIILRDASQSPYQGNLPFADIIAKTVREVVSQPKESTQTYLRRLLNSYTLLSFLRETPDVQGAVVKMFSHGEIWLDTSILLPLLAETLFGEAERQYTHLLKAASEAGIRLYVTEGVIEEVIAHLRRAVACAETSAGWKGQVPFLFAIWTFVGRGRGAFKKWSEEFRGRERPEDDLADFLKDEFGIELGSHAEAIARVDNELRIQVGELWKKIHEKRRKDQDISELLTLKLAEHDAENYLGIIARRSGGQTHFGYSSWLLTLDHTAFTIEQELREYLVGKTPRSPVMSPDFLATNLAVGPTREKMATQTEVMLPIVLSKAALEYLSPEILLEAERVRLESGDLSERQLRRRIRDAIDAARRRRGILAERGLEALETEARRLGDNKQDTNH